MTAPAATRHTENVTHYQMYIDGAWTDGQAPGRLDVENPANELVFATVPVGSVNDATAALEAAKRAQPAWAALRPSCGQATSLISPQQSIGKRLTSHASWCLNRESP